MKTVTSESHMFWKKGYQDPNTTLETIIVSRKEASMESKSKQTWPCRQRYTRNFFIFLWILVYKTFYSSLFSMSYLANDATILWGTLACIIHAPPFVICQRYPRAPSNDQLPVYTKECRNSRPLVLPRLPTWWDICESNGCCPDSWNCCSGSSFPSIILFSLKF